MSRTTYLSEKSYCWKILFYANWIELCSILCMVSVHHVGGLPWLLLSSEGFYSNNLLVHLSLFSCATYPANIYFIHIHIFYFHSSVTLFVFCMVYRCNPKFWSFDFSLCGYQCISILLVSLSVFRSICYNWKHTLIVYLSLGSLGS